MVMHPLVLYAGTTSMLTGAGQFVTRKIKVYVEMKKG